MLHRHWVSLSNAICLPGMPCSLPRWTEPVLLSVTSRLVLPSPFPRRVGVHDFAFEACSSFTRVTACRVARPPYSGLCHEASTRPVARAGPLVSYHVYRQLHGWVLPPLANCAGKAHSEIPGYDYHAVRGPPGGRFRCHSVGARCGCCSLRRVRKARPCPFLFRSKWMSSGTPTTIRPASRLLKLSIKGSAQITVEIQHKGGPSLMFSLGRSFESR